MNKSELLVSIAGLPDGDPKIARAAAVMSGTGDTAVRPASLRLFKIGEATKELGVSRPTLWRMVQEGLIKTVELRKGMKRIPESELRRIVAV